jgi:hypothetical protein
MKTTDGHKGEKSISNMVGISIALTGVTFLFTAFLVTLAFGVGADRTIVISAQSASMEIQFSGDAGFWDLGSVLVCEPLAKIDRSRTRGTDICDPRRYEQKHEIVSLKWQDGSHIVVLANKEGSLEIRLKNVAKYKSGTILHLPREEWTALGALSFSGFIHLGQVAATGETRLLTSGTYDIREKPFLMNATETIKNGSFRPGEKVGVFRDDGKEQSQTRVYGYVLPSQHGLKNFQVSLVSETGPSKIFVSYWGGEDRIEIAPNWIDRSIASPLILALSILVPVFIAIAQMLLTATNSLSPIGLSAALRCFRRSTRP